LDQNIQNNEKFRSHLVEAYLKKSGSFRKVLGLLLAFAASFAFLIAWPYMSALHQERNLTREISSVNKELEQLSKNLKLFKTPKNRIGELNNMVETGPKMLRDYIESISENRYFGYPPGSPACNYLMDGSSQNRMQQMQALPQHPDAPMIQMNAPPPQEVERAGAESIACTGMSKSEQNVCRIDRFVQYQLCTYEQFFKSSVLPSLAHLVADGSPLFDQNELDRQFAEVREALHKHINANPTFWHTFQGKGLMSVELNEEVRQLWKALSAKIEPMSEALAERMKSADALKQKLMGNEKQLAKQRETLQAQLARIKSPIGNLPIGLTESVLLFPILLAIGYVMAAANFLEQVRLRTSLMQAESFGGTSEDVLSSRELAQVAPLWIEPKGKDVFWRWILLLIPAVVFLITVAAIAFHEIGAEETMFKEAGIGGNVYWLLYVISAVAIFVCLRRIKKALSYIRENFALPTTGIDEVPHRGDWH